MGLVLEIYSLYWFFPQVPYYYTWNVLLLLGLGYHRDPQTRAAFMEVLTKILQQGTEFETLAETALADRFELVNKICIILPDLICTLRLYHMLIYLTIPDSND